MTDAKTLQPGDVVQLEPESDNLFGGHFMVVEEVRSWGAQGYVQSLERRGALAYYRAKHEAMHYVGRAVFVATLKPEEDEFDATKCSHASADCAESCEACRFYAEERARQS